MDEKIIWQGKPSQLINLIAYLFWGTLFLLILIPLVYFWQKLHETWMALPWIGLATSLFCLCVMAARWLATNSRKYTLSSERLLVEKGIFSRQLQSLELYRVKDYTLTEPFFYRIAKLGNIIVVTSDPTSHNLEISAISQPRNLLDTLRRQVETRRDAKRVRELDMDAIDDLSGTP
jgi:uncharacterized membrane protein YdbT with pleckstrin-like domain